MTVDEFNQGVQALMEGWNDIMRSVAEAAESIQKAWAAVFSDPKVWPKRNGVPPKKYGMSLRKRPYRALPCYSYIPIVSRNLPYQRRAY